MSGCPKRLGVIGSHDSNRARATAKGKALDFLFAGVVRTQARKSGLKLSFWVA